MDRYRKWNEVFLLRSIPAYTVIWWWQKRRKIRGLIGFHRSKQMTIVKSKSGRREKHVNEGQFVKKVQVDCLGLVHIWLLAFGNKYYLRVCYNPQFIATGRLRNLRLFFNFCGNPLWVQPKTRELTSPPFLSRIIF